MILLLSTELEELLTLSDRIGVLFRGKIEKTFERSEFSKEEIGRAMLGGKTEN